MLKFMRPRFELSSFARLEQVHVGLSSQRIDSLAARYGATIGRTARQPTRYVRHRGDHGWRHPNLGPE
jgi:hypothetical protein